MQAQNWHDAGHKKGPGGPDLARGPPVDKPQRLTLSVMALEAPVQNILGPPCVHV